MAYEINKFDGTLLVSVDDQTVNATSTDLRFVGRNYAGYGEIQNENFLWLLQNFANTSAPPRAIQGQLWFDGKTNKLKVFDGQIFKSVGGADVSAVAPAGLATGDFWYDSVNQQIKVWTGTEFVLVGPEKAPTFGTTAVLPGVIKDTVGSDQSIIRLQVAGEVIAIITKTDFNINPAINPIAGFSELKKGINFINSSATTGVTTSAHRFWGTVANADRLGGYNAADFLRSSNTYFTTLAGFADAGFTVGDQKDLKIQIANGDTPIIENTLGKSFIFRISDSGQNPKDVVQIKSTGMDPGSTGLYTLGTVGAKWKEVNAETVKATTFYGKFVGTIESPPAAPGSTPPPLAIQSVAVAGDFAMGGSGSTSSNFNINLAGGTGAVNLASGAVGSINNFNIGGTTRGTGAFTALTASGTLTVTSAAPAASTSTGSLVVSGGVGISGKMYVGNDAYFTGTGAIQVPVGTTEQRPVDAVLGMIRFNTDAGEWEGFDGDVWRTIGSAGLDDYGQITSAGIEATIQNGLIIEPVDSFVDYGGLF